MIEVGTYNYLRVKDISPEGVILTDGEQEILLPGTLSQPVDTGDELLVFLYHHKDGRVVATTKKPYACAGDFSFLKVVDKNESGTFLDMGIDKDLFVPSSKQKYNLQVGRRYVVYVYVDQAQNMITSSRIFENSGNIYEYSISNLKTNIPLDDAMFVFNKAKHPGVDEIQQ